MSFGFCKPQSCYMNADVTVLLRFMLGCTCAFSVHVRQVIFLPISPL